MTKIIIWICVTIGGWIGWWLGAKLGFGWAFFISGLGSVAGVFIGWKIAQEYF